MSSSSHPAKTTSAQDPVHTVPPLCDDVINAIIDCFDRPGDSSNCHPMLATCSQVCRAWTHRSQTHLLRHIYLSSEYRLAKFISALPTLSERVRRLMRSLSIQAPYPLADAEIHVTNIYKLSLANMIALLDALPCLDYLGLSRVQLETAAEDALRQEDYSSRRKPLQYLDIFDVTSPSSIHPYLDLAGIATYMALFQSVSSLTIRFYDARVVDDLDVTDAFTSISQKVSAHLPPCINAANIDGPVSLIRFLHGLGVAGSLRNLEFHDRHDTVVAVEKLLGDNPGGINVLKINFDSDEYEDPTLARNGNDVWSIDASTLTNLRELELSFSFASDDRPQAQTIVQWDRMVTILRHLSAASVESIVMWLFMGPLDPQSVIPALQTHPWGDLDVVLQGYETLNKPLTLTLHADCDISRSMGRQCMEIIEEGLPSLKMRTGEARKAHLIWMYWDEMSLETVDLDVLKTESVQVQSP